MRSTDEIDFAKLMGFALVADRRPGKVDFQDEAVSARLGAKVGTELMAALDFAYTLSLEAGKNEPRR
jgi:hypothetical protein